MPDKRSKIKMLLRKNKMTLLYYIAMVLSPFRKHIEKLFYWLKEKGRHNFIFVCGATRSGTTFLAKSLTIDEERCLYIHEPVKEILLIKTRGMDRDERYDYMMSNRQVWTHCLIFALSVYMLHYLFMRKTMVICVKETIDESFEDLARILGGNTVCIVRHPCGRIESMRRGNRSGIIFNLANLKLTAHKWAKTYYWIMSKFQDRLNGGIIYFEKLCLDPLSEYKKLYEMLGLEWSSKVEKDILIRTTTPSDEFYGTNRIAADQVDKWKHRLTAEEIAAIREGCLLCETDLYEGF